MKPDTRSSECFPPTVHVLRNVRLNKIGRGGLIAVSLSLLVLPFSILYLDAEFIAVCVNGVERRNDFIKCSYIAANSDVIICKKHGSLIHEVVDSMKPLYMVIVFGGFKFQRFLGILMSRRLFDPNWISR